jgi:hypothetical protein
MVGPISSADRTNILPQLTLFAARLILLIGRTGALRLIGLRLFGLLRWFVFALGHYPLLVSSQFLWHIILNPSGFKLGVIRLGPSLKFKKTQLAFLSTAAGC